MCVFYFSVICKQQPRKRQAIVFGVVVQLCYTRYDNNHKRKTNMNLTCENCGAEYGVSIDTYNKRINNRKAKNVKLLCPDCIDLFILQLIGKSFTFSGPHSFGYKGPASGSASGSAGSSYVGGTLVTSGPKSGSYVGGRLVAGQAAGSRVGGHLVTTGPQSGSYVGGHVVTAAEVAAANRNTGSNHPATASRYPVTGSNYPATASRYPVTGSNYPATASRYPVTGSNYYR
jgi:hypothetical protein